MGPHVDQPDSNLLVPETQLGSDSITRAVAHALDKRGKRKVEASSVEAVDSKNIFHSFGGTGSPIPTLKPQVPSFSHISLPSRMNLEEDIPLAVLKTRRYKVISRKGKLPTAVGEESDGDSLVVGRGISSVYGFFYGYWC